MNITASLLLGEVLKHGPSIVGLVGQLAAMIKSGDKPLTAEDFALLDKYASAKASDYLNPPL